MGYDSTHHLPARHRPHKDSAVGLRVKEQRFRVVILWPAVIEVEEHAHKQRASRFPASVSHNNKNVHHQQANDQSPVHVCQVANIPNAMCCLQTKRIKSTHALTEGVQARKNDISHYETSETSTSDSLKWSKVLKRSDQPL